MLRLTIDPHKPDEAALGEAAAIIKNEGIAVYPTETVYGLAARYDSQAALELLFAVKLRKELNPVLLLIENADQLKMLAADIPADAQQFAERWWPGPLTLLFKARHGLSTLLTGDAGKVACRISSSTIAQNLVRLAGCPITSTSANFTGGPNASRIEDIPKELLERVDVIIDAGETPGGPASTLLDISVRPFKILREGTIPSDRLL